MTAAGSRRALLAALALLALGGLLLHLRAHPVFLADRAHPGATLFRPAFIAASLLPLLDLLLVTALFSSRRSAVYGYLLNGLIVIYGSVLMAHFSLAALFAPQGPAFADWVLRTTFPDIAIAWGDFFVGKALYDSWMREV